MPLYRTGPDVSLEDLVKHLEWIGEEILDRHRLDDGEWSILTKPGRTSGNIYYGPTETRSA